MEGRHKKELNALKAKKKKDLEQAARTKLQSRSVESISASAAGPPDPKDKSRQKTQELEKREIERFESNPKMLRKAEQKDIEAAKHRLAALKNPTISSASGASDPCEPKQTLKQLQEQKRYPSSAVAPQSQVVTAAAAAVAAVAAVAAPSTNHPPPPPPDSVEWAEFSSARAAQTQPPATNFVSAPVHASTQSGSAKYLVHQPPPPTQQYASQKPPSTTTTTTTTTTITPPTVTPPTVNKPEPSTLDEFDPYRPIERKS